MEFAPLYPWLYHYLKPQFPQCLWQGDPNQATVALTFDDGPHPDYTPPLLDLLAQHQVRASFFLLGALVERNPELVREMYRQGHQRMKATNDTVITTQRGSYLIVASPQVTATKDGGCFDAWIVVNGEDVDNSGVRLCQAKAGNTNVVVSQLIMNLQKGDKIQVKSSGKDVKLDAIKPPVGPLIPSIILSVVGID